VNYKAMIWNVLIVTVVIALWFWYGSNRDRALFTAAAGRVCANLSAGEANAWLRDHPETQVLDVRSQGEFRGGALPKAVNISIGDASFDSKAASLDKAKPVLVYCASGMRSRTAVGRLKQLGFENIQHIHRGYMSWNPDTQP
jgi:rhodanese-related sulfurtransferase